jgi:hypothetical protein
MFESDKWLKATDQMHHVRALVYQQWILTEEEQDE